MRNYPFEPGAGLDVSLRGLHVSRWEAGPEIGPGSVSVGGRRVGRVNLGKDGFFKCGPIPARVPCGNASRTGVIVHGAAGPIESGLGLERPAAAPV